MDKFLHNLISAMIKQCPTSNDHGLTRSMQFQQWLYPSPTTLALPPPLLVVGKRSIGKTHLINGMLKKNTELKHCDLYGNYPPESYKAGHIYEATAVPDDYVGAVLTMTLSYRRA